MVVARDCFKYVKEKVEIEMNSATDNPLIFYEDEEGHIREETSMGK